jgi:RNA polymerase sigma-70 factor (ECF subfamily)
VKTQESSQSEDESLVRDFKNGDRAVFGKLYSKYYKKVFSKCYSFTQDSTEASDLAQDILLKTFEHIHSFKGKSKFSTWLYAITYNHCIEHIRKKKLQNKIFLKENLERPDEEGVEDENSTPEKLINLLNESLEILSAEEKELLSLKYEKNLTVKEIQNALNISASAVKMRLKRARDKVEQIYQTSHSKLLKQLN